MQKSFIMKLFLSFKDFCPITQSLYHAIQKKIYLRFYILVLTSYETCIFIGKIKHMCNITCIYNKLSCSGVNGGFTLVESSVLFKVLSKTKLHLNRFIVCRAVLQN